MSNQYIHFWYVRSHSDPNKEYKVSQREDGSHACSCPAWIYQRARLANGECKHIQEVKMGGAQAIQVDNQFMVA